MTPRPLDSPSAVNQLLTPNRRHRVVENDEYAAFLQRVIRAYSRRVATGDIEAITERDLTQPSRTRLLACGLPATAGPTSQPA
jgi:hypothetical protein